MGKTESQVHTAGDSRDNISFGVFGAPESPTHRWFFEGLLGEMVRLGNVAREDPADAMLVLNLTKADAPAPFRRRKTQATYSVAIVENDHAPQEFIAAAYTVLVRSLSNIVIYLVRNEYQTDAHFVTMEQGHYIVRQDPAQPDWVFFGEIFRRLEPLVTARLIINNIYTPDLPESLWEGDEITRQCTWAGERLEELGLLPAPWPIEDLLEPRDLRHVMLLYGIGGLSYGNLSARKDKDSFWMSASGVKKSQLRDVGRDLLLVTGYDRAESAMILSVPPHVKPRRVSVDAIEHYMIYEEHPEVHAILHIHAWIDGVASTEINFPCGTQELAQSVSDLVRKAPDPSRAVVGLKNHGLTITGRSLEEIFERIDGRVLPQVPMS